MRQTSLVLTLSGLVALAALTGNCACRAQDGAAKAKDAPVKFATPTEQDKALAEFFRQAIKNQEQEKIQEVLSLLTDGSSEARRWVGISESLGGDNKMVMALSGELPVSEADMAAARVALNRLKGYIESYRRVARPQAYTLRKISPATTLDGMLAAGDKLEGFTPVQMDIAFPKEKPSVPSPAMCEMGWTDDALYLRYRVKDATPVSKYVERDSAVYEDDCVELFFVSKSNPAQYWELNIGRNTGIRDVFIKKQTGKWFGALSKEATLKGMEFKITDLKNNGQPSGYTIVAKIPWSSLLVGGARAKAGDQFPFAVGYSDTFKKPDGSPGQVYYSNIYTWVGYHDVTRYDTLKLAE